MKKVYKAHWEFNKRKHTESLKHIHTPSQLRCVPIYTAVAHRQYRYSINTYAQAGTDREEIRDGMEEMLSGRDTGAIGCANKHCLPCLAVA